MTFVVIVALLQVQKVLFGWKEATTLHTPWPVVDIG